MIYYQVLVIQNTKIDLFDYSSEISINIGTIVIIYFGKKKTFGCIWKETKNTFSGKIKNIEKITEIILSKEILFFILEVEKKILCQKNTILKNLIYKMPKKILKLKKKENLEKISFDNSLLLNQSQQFIYENIKNKNDISLIFGVTGSGKTEVYFKIIEDIILNGGQVLFLLPEISIISGIIERIKKFFNCLVISWFSKNKSSKDWQNIYEGTPLIVVGARSSIFLPFKNLKLIVMDEEHDLSYKQSNNFIYHCRDICLIWQDILKIPLILGSATPSLETYYLAIKNFYNLFFLKERYGTGALPKIKIIEEKKNQININCLKKIEEVLEKKKQVLIYLNKRGFGNCLICLNCEKKQKCLFCDQLLVLHNLKNQLKCHLCNKIYKKKICLFCHQDKFIIHGYGVEKLENFIRNKFPKYTIGIFSSDFCNSKKKINDFINKIKNKEISIIIGTQMIAKGHNFPDLSLVFIVNTNLQGGDFRSREILLQNLLQVSGRSGRYEKESLVLIQNNDKKIEEFLWENKYEDFLKKLLIEREKYNLPPFFSLCMIKLNHKNLKKIEIISKEIFHIIYSHIQNFNLDVEIYPPTTYPIQKINNIYRIFIYLKTKNSKFFFLKELLNKTNYSLYIDINPYEFI